eukprot:m.246360 g.246360  ORF g.246360 m.246360 type:complete len:619 (-) comp15015_c0_seq1:118-1974(-)
MKRSGQPPLTAVVLGPPPSGIAVEDGKIKLSLKTGAKTLEPGKIFSPDIDGLVAAAGGWIDAGANGVNAALVHLSGTPKARYEAIQGETRDKDCLPRVLQELFGRITGVVAASLIMIHEKKSYDLLVPLAADPTLARLPYVGLHLDNVAEIVVTTAVEAQHLYREGLRIAATIAPGSASNAVVLLVLNIYNEQAPRPWRTRLVLVDVCGTDTASCWDAVRGPAAWVAPLVADGLAWFTIGVHSDGSPAAVDRAFSEANALLSGPHSKTPAPQLTQLLGNIRAKIKDSMSATTKEQVTALEQLAKELNIAKQSAAATKNATSIEQQTLRRRALAKCGLADAIAEEDPAELTQRLAELQAEKEAQVALYRQQKKLVDDTKDALQTLIAKFAKEQSGMDAAQQATFNTKIKAAKDELVAHNEQLKATRTRLTAISDQHRDLRTKAQAARRDDLESFDFHREAAMSTWQALQQDNAAFLARETDRITIETAEERAAIYARHVADGNAPAQVLGIELTLADARAESRLSQLQHAIAAAEVAHLAEALRLSFAAQGVHAAAQQERYLQAFRDFRAEAQERLDGAIGVHRTAMRGAIEDAVALAARNAELEGEVRRLQEALKAKA